ncbi:RDD family protein [Sulfurimonas lithotrophica]|uniref:RDD family protein n=1 Tax=Sulfurimonas lithotrophica TaxID=2590022 RepID=A0A5P8P215_9BACT|nr:RDD family protein [Sulfurimonas lithotrophica]QFR49647.1 RDD family protein [Sulfurimonas lithotrophica]
MSEVKYAGFWIRFLASFLDTLFLAIPVAVIIYFLSGGEWFDFAQYQLNMQAAMAGNAHYALTNQPQMSMKWELLFEFSILIVSIIFWRRWRGATPGKKYLKIKIVDANTLEDINNKQAITRSLGYIISTLALLIGFLMVGFRKDKRALHDLLSGTIVIYE